MFYAVIRHFRNMLCFVKIMVTQKSQNAQYEVLHVSQYRAHVSVECFEHLGVDPRKPNETITCSLDSSEICSPTHFSQRCMWQTSQCLEVTGVSQRSQRMRSWRSSGNSMYLQTDSSEICSLSHSSQRWTLQTSQGLVGTGVSQRSRRMTSWGLICMYLGSHC